MAIVVLLSLALALNFGACMLIGDVVAFLYLLSAGTFLRRLYWSTFAIVGVACLLLLTAQLWPLALHGLPPYERPPAGLESLNVASPYALSFFFVAPLLKAGHLALLSARRQRDRA